MAVLEPCLLIEGVVDCIGLGGGGGVGGGW